MKSFYLAPVFASCAVIIILLGLVSTANADGCCGGNVVITLNQQDPTQVTFLIGVNEREVRINQGPDPFPMYQYKICMCNKQYNGTDCFFITGQTSDPNQQDLRSTGCNWLTMVHDEDTCYLQAEHCDQAPVLP